MDKAYFDSLNSKTHMPYYVQIKCYLRQLIQELPPNAMIPSEKELADKFGVSRGTAKQAIMDLVYEGTLYRKQGKGTFISSQIVRSYKDLPTFTRDIERSGHKAFCRPLSFQTSAPAPRARLFFGLLDDETVIRYKRIVYEGDEPIAIVSSFLNDHLFHGLQLSEIGDSLYSALEKKYGYAPAQAHDSYRVAEISPKTAKLLNQAEGGFIIYSERLACLSDGTPAEFVESFIRADKFKIEVDYKNNSSDASSSASINVNFSLLENEQQL